MPRFLDLTTVVNIRDEYTDHAVYIGRKGKGKDGYFGNPFRLKRGASDKEREACLAQYREYFYDRLATDPEFKSRIDALQYKTLGCFCAPKLCHGDVIADYLNKIKPLWDKFIREVKAATADFNPDATFKIEWVEERGTLFGEWTIGEWEFSLPLAPNNTTEPPTQTPKELVAIVADEYSRR
jgi:hypothetical protein